MKEELEKFLKDMEENKNFKEAFLSFVEEIKKQNAEITKDEIIQKFANEKGYNIGIEVINKLHSLSDEELANISGGLIDEPDPFCSVKQGQPAPQEKFGDEIRNIPVIGGKAGRTMDIIDFFKEIWDWF